MYPARCVQLDASRRDASSEMHLHRRVYGCIFRFRYVRLFLFVFIGPQSDANLQIAPAKTDIMKMCFVYTAFAIVQENEEYKLFENQTKGFEKT